MARIYYFLLRNYVQFADGQSGRPFCLEGCCSQNVHFIIIFYFFSLVCVCTIRRGVEKIWTALICCFFLPALGRNTRVGILRLLVWNIESSLQRRIMLLKFPSMIYEGMNDHGAIYFIHET